MRKQAIYTHSQLRAAVELLLAAAAHLPWARQAGAARTTAEEAVLHLTNTEPFLSLPG